MNEARWRERVEIAGTVVISIATLAIAWCSYQGALWGGIQTVSLIESGDDDRRALEKSAQMKHQQEVDAMVMINFAEAVIDKKEEKVNFYLTRGRSELVQICKAWLKMDPLHNPAAPPHPMAMKEYQDLMSKITDEENKFRKSSEILKDRGLKANYYSDNYALLTVIFGIVLFLNGLSAKVKSARIMSVFAISSAVICVIGLLLLLLTLPVTAPE
jgi:hypothetical protein